MLRVALKGAMARKLRLLLTSIAVVLGVGFVSGAFFLTDSMRASFDNIFTQATQNIDLHIQTQEYRRLSKKQQSSHPGTVTIDMSKVGVPPSAIKTLKKLPGVDKAVGSIFETGAIVLGSDNKPVQNGGAPSFDANWSNDAKNVGALRIVKGHAPKADEVLLDASVMRKGKFKLGDKTQVLTQGGRNAETFKISGVVQFGDRENLNGASITVFQTKRLQELFDMGDRFTSVDVKATQDANRAALKRNAQRALGSDYLVQTGSQFSQEQQEAIDNSFLKILQNVILGFAAVAVFVGAFTIFNTFTILVGQRTREIGLLRAIGAGRKQVLGIVLLEALIVGVIASSLGLVAGYGVAWLLREILNTVGFKLPSESFPWESRTIIAAYSVGIIITVIASLIPAWRASRLSPLEALRSNAAREGRSWKMLAFGAVLILIGAIAVISGFEAKGASVSNTLTKIGGGFAIVIIGISLVSRMLVYPVTKALAPIFARDTAGKIAAGNVLRNRARSATTSSALMIGLALASLVLVFQSSLTNTVDAEITRTLGADITIYNSAALQGGYGYVNQKSIDKIKKVDGVTNTSGQRLGTLSISKKYDTNKTNMVTSFDPSALEKDGSIKLDILKGENKPTNGILVDSDLAKSKHLKIGSKTYLSFSTLKSYEFKVEGIFKPNQFTGAPIIMNLDSFNKFQPPASQAVSMLYVNVANGEDSSVVAKRIKKALGKKSAYLDVQDTEAMRSTFREQLAPILGLVFGMLSLSLVIALFGIGNTLALNVFERTREIGLLRAVGATRRQMRRIIRAEAILVSIFGAIIGVLVGLIAGWSLIQALRDQGFVFAVSIPTLLVILFVGFLAGILASILPAIRAAKTNVLEAIATE